MTGSDESLPRAAARRTPGARTLGREFGWRDCERERPAAVPRRIESRLRTLQSLAEGLLAAYDQRIGGGSSR